MPRAHGRFDQVIDERVQGAAILDHHGPERP